MAGYFNPAIKVGDKVVLNTETEGDLLYGWLEANPAPYYVINSVKEEEEPVYTVEGCPYPFCEDDIIDIYRDGVYCNDVPSLIEGLKQQVTKPISENEEDWSWDALIDGIHLTMESEGVSFEEAMDMELEDASYDSSHIVNIWCTMPEVYGVNTGELTDLMLEDIKAGLRTKFKEN